MLLNVNLLDPDDMQCIQINHSAPSAFIQVNVNSPALPIVKDAMLLMCVITHQEL